LKKKYEDEETKETNQKNVFHKEDAAASAADEKKMKEEQKQRDEEFKTAMDNEKQKLVAKESRSKNCKLTLKDRQVQLDEAKHEEKVAKTKMANEEGAVEKWYARAQMSTHENHKKQYDEFVKESKESLSKITVDEQRYVKNQMKAQRVESTTKEKCKKRAQAKKDMKKKILQDQQEQQQKKKEEEGKEQNRIKERGLKQKESDSKETVTKEQDMKKAHVKHKEEKVNKENHATEQTLKEKMKKMEVKEKETDLKEASHKKLVKDAETQELKIKEASTKTKAKEELQFKEKYFKETKAKEKAEKDSAHMTQEQNDKEKKRAEQREEAAAAKHAENEKKVIEAKDEKTQKVAMERLSKAEEGTIKVKMKRVRLSAVRRNDAGVVKVPAPGGTIMVGGGMINHYRKWNGRSIFEESYPDGDSWRCDSGVGNTGMLTCISLAYALPKGTKCVNARVYTANAGVIHATLPPGYLMTSGGVQNLHRRFDKHSAFEESMPDGDRKWRCDTGFGRGELNCFVRGCKFPFGAHCVTTEGSSDKAGWVWAECPEGYNVMGCGMRNHYLEFDPRSGFEDLRPVGNKCLGDMGFGPGRITVYARCCKVHGPPPEIAAPPPPPTPGTANPDNIKCIGERRWEIKKNSDCVGGDSDQMPVTPGDKNKLGDQLEACALKCGQKQSCKGFTFPKAKGGGNVCKLKGDKDYVFSEELALTCVTQMNTDDWNSFALLGGTCQKRTANLDGIVIADRRRRQDVSKHRTENELGEVGEAKQAPNDHTNHGRGVIHFTGGKKMGQQIKDYFGDKGHWQEKLSALHERHAKDEAIRLGYKIQGKYAHAPAKEYAEYAQQVTNTAVLKMRARKAKRAAKMRARKLGETAQSNKLGEAQKTGEAEQTLDDALPRSTSDVHVLDH